MAIIVGAKPHASAERRALICATGSRPFLYSAGQS
jgi:hypothetical protein